METLWQDLKYAARMLARSPGFTVVAVLTLALGIGANTAIFSLIHAVLLRPLPFPEPDRLVMLWERRPASSREANIPVSGHEYMAWKERNQVFERVALYGSDTLNLTGEGEPESILAQRVCADFFPLLGVRPRMGRIFAAGEDRAGHDRVAILSDGFWRRRFGSDAGIVGQNITLNDQAYTVIGVMPPLPESVTPAIWLPLDVPSEAQKVGRHNLQVVARLKEGVASEQAQSDMDVIAQGIERELPQANTGHRVKVIPFREDMVGHLRLAFVVLVVAVGFVLLIACVNVANLLLTRTAGRQQEIAVRTALGASRARLIRQLLIESVLLAALGGGTGLLVAAWIVDLIPRITAVNIPLIERTRFDQPVFALALGLSLLTGIVTGFVPALRGSRPAMTKWLNEGNRMSAERSHRRWGSVLVACEVTLAIVLLVGAGLMIRSFAHLVRVDAGFDPNHVLVMPVSLRGARYAQAEQRKMFAEQLVERIQSLPGIEAAGATTNLPLGGGDNWMAVAIEGRPAPPPGQELYAPTRVVTSDYFRALKIPLRRGRYFSQTDARISVPLVRWFPTQPYPPNFDKAQPAPVAIISEAMARQYWPDEDPIGKRFRLLFSPAITVVGVVGDVKHNALDGPSYPHIYVPHSQEPWGEMTFVVRTTGPPQQFAAAVREKVRGLDANLPVSVTAMAEVFSESIGRQRFYALLVGSFGALALGLAVVGIFAVVSYSAAQRTREIGVRMALGAQRRDIVRLIIGQAMLPILAGVVIGTGSALALNRFITKLLYEVKPADPLTFGSVCLLLTVAALAACYLPARRATRVDPMVALRYE